jgi:hypothetical protein
MLRKFRSKAEPLELSVREDCTTETHVQTCKMTEFQEHEIYGRGTLMQLSIIERHNVVRVQTTDTSV